jgi:glycosyltransferase involved in cell wall biosynthesis
MQAGRRLLLLSERFPPDLGGVARSAARMARRLAGMGHQVHVLCWTKQLAGGQLDSQAPEDAGPIVHRLGMFGNLDSTLQHTMNVVEWLGQQQQFDVVWGHYLFPMGFAAATFAGLLGLPCVVNARGNDIDRLMFPPGDFARLLWTLERADVVTAVSADLADKIDRLTRRPDAVEVLGNAVDGEVFRDCGADLQLRRQYGIGAHEQVLGFCGELRHKKGLPFLLSALAEVAPVRPACLLVIGQVRVREQSTLVSFQAEFPQAGRRILVTGALDDPAEVARHLSVCDLVLMPSLWDGLPNALLEAMACERLVIASDAGGIPEVVEHGRTGLLLPRAHLHRLGAAVNDALQRPLAERAAIGAAARRHVLQTRNAGAEIQALRRVLQRLTPAG